MSNGGNPAAQVPSTVVLKLWAVPHKGIITVRFLGEMKTCMTHFVNVKPKGHGEVCLHENCPPALHRLKAIWKGYAPVEIYRKDSDDWYPGVIEITEALGQQFDGRKLLGEIWDIERVMGEFRHPEAVGVFLGVERPAPIDARNWVDTVCFRLYHTREIRWGEKSPLPMRVRLEIRKGTRPPGTPAPQEPTPAPEKPTNGHQRSPGLKTWEKVIQAGPKPT